MSKKYDLTTVAFVFLLIALAVVIFYADDAYSKRYGRIEAGVITRKLYNRAYTSTNQEAIPNTSPTQYRQSTNYYPERFYIQIEGDGKTNWVDLPQAMWNEVELGQKFKRDCFCVISQ